MGKGLRVSLSIEEARVLRAAAVLVLAGTADVLEQRRWLGIRKSVECAIRWFESDDEPKRTERGACDHPHEGLALYRLSEVPGIALWCAECGAVRVDGLGVTGPWASPRSAHRTGDPR